MAEDGCDCSSSGPLTKHVRAIDPSRKLGPPPGREGRREPLPPGRPISRLRKESSPSPVCGRKAALLPPAEGKQPFSRLRENVSLCHACGDQASRAAVSAVRCTPANDNLPICHPRAPYYNFTAHLSPRTSRARSFTHD